MSPVTPQASSAPLLYHELAASAGALPRLLVSSGGALLLVSSCLMMAAYMDAISDPA